MADGLSFSIKIENNIPLAEKASKEATERALYAIGDKAVEGSVRAISGKLSIDSAVDTGRLRASISFITPTQKSGQMTPQTPKEGSLKDISKNPLKSGDILSGEAEEKTVIIGSNVEYAEYVHNGASGMAARPFLREGIDQTKDQMKKQVERIFKGEL